MFANAAIFRASCILCIAWAGTIVAATPVLAQGTIATIAGGGPANGASATAIGLNPSSIAIDVNGNLYIGDSSSRRILKMAPDGTITTVAGNGASGYSGDGGPATSARLSSPAGLAIDAGGNLYFADSLNNRIRKVAPDGTITTVAGNGTYGFNGDGGPATSAQLWGPKGLTIDASGNLYIADFYNASVRKVTAAGTITTVAGTRATGWPTSAQLNYPTGVATDGGGNLYIADSHNNLIRKLATDGTVTTVAGNGSSGYSGDGGPATSAQLNNPLGLAVDASGNLYIADWGNNRIRKVASDGTITTVAGDGTSGYSGDGGPATSASLQAGAVAIDASGNLYIADYGNYSVRKVTSDGTITTVAGNGFASFSGDNGPAISAQLSQPWGMAFDASGNLYFSDRGNNRVRKVAASSGLITTVAGDGDAGFHISGDNVPATSAQLNAPNAVVFDAGGNLYISDTYNQRIRKVGTDGTITTVAGNGTYGYSGDNGPGISAELNFPTGLAIDASGNLYIGDFYNYRVRRLAPDGTITTVAGTGIQGYSGDGGPATSAQLGTPSALAIDAGGNLYIVDYSNYRVRKLAPDGTITTVAGTGTNGYSGDGGPATSANISPYAVAADGSGNLYISGNSRVRVVTPDGTINAVAGTGSFGYSGDGGPATSAQFSPPDLLAVDAGGNLYIGDSGNNRVRKIVFSADIGTTTTSTSTTTTTTSTVATTTTTTSTTTTTLAASSAVTLNLVAGWNLLGNSSSGTLDVAATFNDASKASTIWKWVPSKSTWAFYTPMQTDGGAAYAAGKGYQLLSSVNGGEGFWVNAKVPFTAQLPAGTAITSSSFQSTLLAGWNLIAIGDNKTPSQFNQALSTTPPSPGVIPINLTTLWAWDAGQSTWYFYAPSLEAKGGTALADYATSRGYLDFGTKVLDPATGFWVNKP